MSAKQVASSSRRTVRRAKDLIEAELIAEHDAEAIEEVSKSFSLAVTPEMIDLIDRAAENDPIALQYIPRKEELNVLPVERTDPIGDDVYETIKGIIHRYPDRLLLKPLHVCPVYCRFCFRREKVGPGGQTLTAEELEAALNYIREHKEVWEVILTGGDPLMLSERRLREIIVALDAIEHVEVIRIHTKVPVADPNRITLGVAQALKVKTPVYVVVHCNHPREITETARAGFATLIDAGIPMLSQSVLLKGVNDDPETLTQLFRSLIKARVKPYYLHHGDLAQGTSHFRTSIEEGQRLMRAIRGYVSGICQPTYVLDIPGGFGKVPIGPNYVTENSPGSDYVIEDYHGTKHVYPPRTS